MRVELRDEARDDLVDGAWFYGRQSPGLDKYFIESLGEDLRNLQRRSRRIGEARPARSEQWCDRADRSALFRAETITQ